MQSLFKVKPLFTEVDPHRILLNVGALLDIPTGKYVRGAKGESLMNGGLGLLTGVAGRGNTFKSTFAHYMMLSAASKVASSGIQPYMNTYDTEMNIDLTRLNGFAQRFDVFKDRDLHHEGIWSVTDKTIHLGNEWFVLLKDFLRGEKIKNKRSYMFDTPFLDKDGKVLTTMFPTFGELDSISEFETADIEEIQNKNQLGESGGNTIHMRAGLAKTRLLMELPGLCNSSAHYTIITAHVGMEGPAMAAGPGNIPPPKKLQHMRQGEKLKGVTDKFFFLPSAVWQTVNASLFNNQTTKGPEYPKTRTDVDAGSQDLNLVTVKMLRNKSGPSGFVIPLIVSQREGILATLSEFHHIKETGRFGLEGNNTTYKLILYPKITIQRTTVRSDIDADPLFRRAIKITADLLQIKQYYKELPFEVPSVEDFYKKLEDEYGWDLLLNTRDFWTFKNYEHPVPFLSTMDMLEMYHGLYIPYWYKPKKKGEAK